MHILGIKPFTIITKLWFVNTNFSPILRFACITESPMNMIKWKFE